MRRCDWFVSRCSTSRFVCSGGAGSNGSGAGSSGKRAKRPETAPFSGTRSRVPTMNAPPRAPAERGAVDDLLGDRRRLVLVALDLLDDDAALAVELGRVDLRAPDEVGEQVDRVHRGLGADGDVEGDEVVARVGVQHA